MRPRLVERGRFGRNKSRIFAFQGVSTSCRRMMLVPLEGQAQPDVDIKKVHLLVLKALQCDRLLDQRYPVRPNQKSAEPREQGFWQNESLDSDDTSRLRLPRLATSGNEASPSSTKTPF